MLFTFLSLLQDTSTLAQEFPCNLLAEKRDALLRQRRPWPGTDMAD
jgi:hypothetical protein